MGSALRVKSTPTSPKRGRPPGSSSDATRQRILRAACACFGQRGYEGTTNNEVGERSGVTGAAIYRYFASKQELYVEAVTAAHREIVPFLRNAVAGANTARDALSALARAYVGAHERFPELTPFLTGIATEMARRPELAAALIAEPENTIMAIIQEIVERGVAQGEIADERAPSVVAMFVSMTIGLSFQVSIAGMSGLDQAVHGFIALLDGDLFTAPTKSDLHRQPG